MTAWIGRSTVKMENPRWVYFISTLQNGKQFISRETLTIFWRYPNMSLSRESQSKIDVVTWQNVIEDDRKLDLCLTTTTGKQYKVISCGNNKKTIHLYVFKAITNHLIMRFDFRSFQELNGPRDKYEAKYPVVVKLHEPIKTRYIRFIPTSAQSPRVMRAELYGCMAEPLPPYKGKLIA